MPSAIPWKPIPIYILAGFQILMPILVLIRWQNNSLVMALCGLGIIAGSMLVDSLKRPPPGTVTLSGKSYHGAYACLIIYLLFASLLFIIYSADDGINRHKFFRHIVLPFTVLQILSSAGFIIVIGLRRHLGSRGSMG